MAKVNQTNEKQPGEIEAAGGPWSKRTSEKFEKKRPGEYFDPCQEAASRSLRCLHRNGGDRDMCSDYFQAYRDCKDQWMTERKKATAAKADSPS